MQEFNDNDFDVLYEDELVDDTKKSDISDDTSGKVTPEDAFVYSMNQKGRVDFAYMEKLTGMRSAELAKCLEGRVIWRDPARYDPMHPYEGWVTREQYVRGNIYRLREQAEKAQKKTGLFASNLWLLDSVLPEGPKAEDIAMTLGASWIPEDVVQSFISELLDMEYYPPKVSFDPFFGTWKVRKGFSYNKALNERVYGTPYMDAKHIIEHMLNATPVRVYDSKWDPDKKKDKRVLNRAKTRAAVEKQGEIAKAFQKWLTDNPSVRERLQDIYTDRYGYQVTHYDGDFLALPDMNPEVHLYRHQKNAIARIVLSQDNTLLSHSVGSGKTYEFEAAVYERIRMGLSHKALLVVPNSVMNGTVQSFQYLYPSVEVHACYPKDFTPKRREAVLQTIEEADSGIFIMAYSSFDKLRMSKDYHLKQFDEQIRYVKSLVSTAKNSTMAKSYEKYAKRLADKRDDFNRDHEEKMEECFDKLGIDLLVVDESHNYKNITLNYTMEPIVGMHSTGSQKADRMLEKCDFIQNAGGKIVFATGTPLTNSLADIFVLQRYLQPKELELLGIDHFNEWVNTFCSKRTEFEIDPSASSYRMVTRFDRFHNLPELMALFSNVCDFYTTNTDDMNLPDFNGYQNIVVRKSPAQDAYIKKIAERTDAIRKGKVSRKKDNYLKVTIDGRKCALDMRLVHTTDELENVLLPVASSEEYLSKVDVCGSKVYEIYQKCPGTTQVIFCDISTPKAAFNVYDAMKEKLISLGIPAEEVRFIHEATTEKKREKMFREFNAGKIRVLLGSTEKLGIGVNIQEKLIAIHHLDAPWRPSDMVQREGRGIRQGNTNAEVFVFRYVTDGSFDAYTWQILESKQRFIASFLSGTMDRSHRSEEDIGDLVLDYAEIKALAIGSPLIRERVELSNQITRERARSFERQRELHSLEDIINQTGSTVSDRKKKIDAVTADIGLYQRQPRQKVSMDERTAYGEKLLKAVEKHTFVGKDRIYGTYKGFKVILPGGLRIDPDHPYVLLQGCGEILHRVDLRDAKPAGVMARIDNTLKDLTKKRDQFQMECDALLRQSEDAEAQLELGNPHEKKIRDLQRKLASIDLELKMSA